MHFMLRITNILISLSYFVGYTYAENTDNNQSSIDLLKGNGNFSHGMSSWTMNSSHLEYHHNEAENYLILKKSSSAETSFTDGLITNIPDTKVGHVRFYFSSTQKEKEDTNFRLKSSQVMNNLKGYKDKNEKHEPKGE